MTKFINTGAAFAAIRCSSFAIRVRAHSGELFFHPQSASSHNVVRFKVWCDAFNASGGNQSIGRSLARLLRAAGAENIKIHPHANMPQVGEYQRTHLLSLIESRQDLMLGPGRLTATELRDHMDALAKHLSDPSTTLIDRLVVQAWGTKPN